jgi:C4-dicarboxylate-specific signal transduction histidine kinase
VRRFIPLIGLAFLLFAAMFFGAGILARDRALADADRELATRAQFFAHALDRTLQQRMIQTFTFAALPSLRAFAASDEANRDARAAMARVELAAIVHADPNVRAATIVDAQGIVIMTTDDAMLANWRARVFVREALRGHLHASAPAREGNAIVQFYSAPILNNAGDIAGALVLRVTAQEMWNALAAPYDVMVVDELGVRLMDRSYTQLFVALAPVPADGSHLLPTHSTVRVLYRTPLHSHTGARRARFAPAPGSARAPGHSAGRAPKESPSGW